MSAVPDRTPMVFVELQLRPSPPSAAEPYFWGAGMLDFLVDGKPVWRAELPSVTGRPPARVERRDGYGWVLVLGYLCNHHDNARSVLGGLGLPGHIVGMELP